MSKDAANTRDSTSPTIQAAALHQELARELVLGAVLLAAWCGLWYVTRDWPNHAAGYVRLILTIAIGLTIAMVLTAVGRYMLSVRRGMSDSPPAVAGQAVGKTATYQATGALPRTDRRSILRLLAFIGAALVYVISISFVGYLVTTIMFAVLMLGPILRWRPVPLVSIVVGISLAFWTVTEQLNLRLPDGWLL